MSSVDFSKCKGAAVGAARIAHMERHDGRDVEYANRWIDKERTHLNSVIDADGLVRDAPNSRQTLERLKKRVQEIDKALPPKRVRKDRVTMVTLTVAAPKGLLKRDEDKFFKIVYDEIAAFCGGTENCSNGFVHRDEIHDYIDTDGIRKRSRPHMHMAVVPYVDGVGVNGKQFVTRARMMALNKHIDQRCREELHIDFLTNVKGLSGRSVEDLQAMSEGKAIEQAKQELDKLNGSLDVLKELYTAREGYIHSLTQNVRPMDVKEHKTLTGKVKSVEVPIDVWEATRLARQSAEDAEKYRRSLEEETETVRRIKELYDANAEWKRQYDVLTRGTLELRAEHEKLKENYTQFKQAVNKIAQHYPGFAQELDQELRPAIDKLVDDYNRKYDQIAKIRKLKEDIKRRGLSH